MKNPVIEIDTPREEAKLKETAAKRLNDFAISSNSLVKLTPEFCCGIC
ncbi:hypothetical protein [Brunnivagina elsteri]|nr:hypothetical protein [Calothrix elsteri]